MFISQLQEPKNIYDFLSTISIPILTLIGVFIGSYVQRQTEFKKWLRSKRAEVFSDFLVVLDRCYRKMDDEINNAKPDEYGNLFIDPIIQYDEAFTLVHIVKLFLRKKDRESFNQLFNDLVLLHGQLHLGVSRLGEMREKKNLIHDLFTKNIETPRW